MAAFVPLPLELVLDVLVVVDEEVFDPVLTEDVVDVLVLFDVEFDVELFVFVDELTLLEVPELLLVLFDVVTLVDVELLVVVPELFPPVFVEELLFELELMLELLDVFVVPLVVVVDVWL